MVRRRSQRLVRQSLAFRWPLPLTASFSATSFKKLSLLMVERSTRPHIENVVPERCCGSIFGLECGVWEDKEGRTERRAERDYIDSRERPC
jgi:hypothetical protein